MLEKKCASIIPVKEEGGDDAVTSWNIGRPVEAEESSGGSVGYIRRLRDTRELLRCYNGNSIKAMTCPRRLHLTCNILVACDRSSDGGGRGW